MESGAAKKGKGAPRTRLEFAQKIEVLGLLDGGWTHSALADRFKCGDRTISRVQEDREDLKKRAASGFSKGSSKSNRKGEFPKVRVQSGFSFCRFFA